jgi:hypothetical protein
VLPEANAEAMNLHLIEISRHVTAGAHAVLLLDGAGWHQPGGKLRIPHNISLLHLPAYSPELNPVENIWQFLRQNFLSNRVYDSYDAIVDGSCPVTWCKSVVGHYALRRGWPVCQSAAAGKLTMELSLRGAIVSSVM